MAEAELVRHLSLWTLAQTHGGQYITKFRLIHELFRLFAHPSATSEQGGNSLTVEYHIVPPSRYRVFPLNYVPKRALGPLDNFMGLTYPTIFRAKFK
jgi:hypothetical protein